MKLTHPITVGASSWARARRGSVWMALCLALLAPGCATSKGQASACPSVSAAHAVPAGAARPDQAAVTRGRLLFQEHCTDCHASDPGERIFLFRDVPSLDCPAYTQAVSPEYLYQAIAEGGKAIGESRFMPGFADKLSQQEIESLVAFLRAPGGAKATAP